MLISGITLFITLFFFKSKFDRERKDVEDYKNILLNIVTPLYLINLMIKIYTKNIFQYFFCEKVKSFRNNLLNATWILVILLWVTYS